MTPDVDVLLDRARSWAVADPDPATRAELEALIAAVEAGPTQPTSPTASAARWSSAPPGCAALSAPDRTG